MKNKLFYLLVSGCLLLSGCGKQIPDDIIQPQEMERVLYDYHMASSMTLNKGTVEKEAYRQHVFKKHRISEAKFDSSMVWYTRDSKLLAEMYTNLSKKFQSEEDRIELLKGELNTDGNTSFVDDSINIWSYPSLNWLTSSPLSDMIRFEIKTDTTFKPKDKLEWTADYIFLSESNATMGLNILFDNDSVMGKTLTLNQTGRQTITLQPDSAYNLKSIHGFIYVYGDSIQKPNVLVHNIELMRYHAPSDSTQVVSATEDKDVKQ